MLVTLVSVIGASVFGKPLLGDTEIVELLVGIAIACFMPYCQMRGSNVIVDFFTMKASPRTKAGLDALMTLVFAIIVAILTERLIEGTVIQYERERVSMFLRLPQWWGYCAASIAAVVWTAVTFYTAWESLRRALKPG
jgi:TRAP-type C4-dicarboxylate transport system permease small subunit